MIRTLENLNKVHNIPMELIREKTENLLKKRELNAGTKSLFVRSSKAQSFEPNSYVY